MTYNPETYWPARYAAEGPQYVAKRGEPDSFDRQLQTFAPALHSLVPSCGKLLDFGCGVGRFSQLLASKCDDYVGADIVAGALEQVPCGRTLLLTDRIPEDGFDVVVAITVLQHIVTLSSFDFWAASIGDALRPGGALVVIEDYGIPPLAPHMCPRGPKVIAAFADLGRFETMPAGPEHWAGIAWKR